MYHDSSWNSSYLLGFDNKYTKDLTYFFTFYSQFGSREAESWIEAIFLGATFLVSLISNLALMMKLTTKEPKTVTSRFLMNLTFSDVMFAAGIPAVMSVRMSPKWRMGDLVCRFLPYSQLVCGFTILWSLTFISIERYRCLTLDPRLALSSSGTHFVIVTMWIFAFALFSPIAFWFRYENDLKICTLMFPRAEGIKISLLFTVLIIIFTCLLPLGILALNYEKIIVKMMANRQKWNLPCVQTSSLSRQEQARVKKHIKVMRLALLNVAVVLVMWLPITIVLILIYIDGDRPITDTSFFLRSHHFILALAVALLNTVVNPFLCGALRIDCFSIAPGGGGLFSTASRAQASSN